MKVFKRGPLVVILGGAIAAALLPAPVGAVDDTAIAQLEAYNHCNGCDLSGADLSGKGLVGAGLANADLRGANLARANLIGANLQEADLTGADLAGALLADADLSGAQLSGATLNGARLGGANLSEASGLTQSQLDAACDDGGGRPYPTRLPPALKLRACP